MAHAAGPLGLWGRSDRLQIYEGYILRLVLGLERGQACHSIAKLLLLSSCAFNDTFTSLPVRL